jgi:hypothetical protein
MAKENSIFISCNLQEGHEDDWVSSFINTLKEASSSFFSATPLTITSSANSNLQVFDVAGAFFIVTDETNGETALQKKELEQINAIHLKKPDLPLFMVQRGKSLPSFAKTFANDSTIYQFCDTDPDTRMPRIYSLQGSQTEYSLFWSLMLDILYDLSSIFKQDDTNTITQRGQVVYVAPTTSDLVVARQRIVRELVQRQFVVLPDGDRSQAAIVNQKDFDILMKRCDLAVHLVGYQYGDFIPGKEVSFTEYNCQQTSDFCIRNKDLLKNKDIRIYRLILLPLQPEKSDDRQQEFLQSLRYDSALDFTEIVQMPIEDVKVLILDRLQQKKKVMATLDINSVYLIYDPLSKDEYEKIAEKLKLSGFIVKAIDYQNKDILLTDQHWHNMATADIVIIIDVNAPDQWILSKIKDVVKTTGIGRLRPFKAKTVITNQEHRLTDIAKYNGFTLLSPSESLDNLLKSWIEP